MSEVLYPIEAFKNFNEFFYRELKPDARPCSAPENPKIIVSPADCRSVVFNRMTEATKIWVKGREFSVERLLGNAYPEDAKRYINGALGIFRLAPQDYHRFHIPVDGVNTILSTLWLSAQPLTSTAKTSAGWCLSTLLLMAV
jgi:phosphatidylserine decarboxylase